MYGEHSTKRILETSGTTMHDIFNVPTSKRRNREHGARRIRTNRGKLKIVKLFFFISNFSTVFSLWYQTGVITRDKTKNTLDIIYPPEPNKLEKIVQSFEQHRIIFIHKTYTDILHGQKTSQTVLGRIIWVVSEKQRSEDEDSLFFNLCGCVQLRNSFAFRGFLR